jgi:hypothetical protein
MHVMAYIPNLLGQQTGESSTCRYFVVIAALFMRKQYLRNSMRHVRIEVVPLEVVDYRVDYMFSLCIIQFATVGHNREQRPGRMPRGDFWNSLNRYEQNESVNAGGY